MGRFVNRNIFVNLLFFHLKIEYWKSIWSLFQNPTTSEPIASASSPTLLPTPATISGFVPFLLPTSSTPSSLTPYLLTTSPASSTSTPSLGFIPHLLTSLSSTSSPSSIIGLVPFLLIRMTSSSSGLAPYLLSTIDTTSTSTKPRGLLPFRLSIITTVGNYIWSGNWIEQIEINLSSVLSYQGSWWSRSVQVSTFCCWVWVVYC